VISLRYWGTPKTPPFLIGTNLLLNLWKRRKARRIKIRRITVGANQRAKRRIKARARKKIRVEALAKAKYSISLTKSAIAQIFTLLYQDPNQTYQRTKSSLRRRTKFLEEKAKGLFQNQDPTTALYLFIRNAKKDPNTLGYCFRMINPSRKWHLPVKNQSLIIDDCIVIFLSSTFAKLVEEHLRGYNNMD
jgi:hypothetical protein